MRSEIKLTSYICSEVKLSYLSGNDENVEIDKLHPFFFFFFKINFSNVGLQCGNQACQYSFIPSTVCMRRIKWSCTFLTFRDV